MNVYEKQLRDRIKRRSHELVQDINLLEIQLKKDSTLRDKMCHLLPQLEDLEDDLS